MVSEKLAVTDCISDSLCNRSDLSETQTIIAMAEGGTPTSDDDLVMCALCMEVYTDPRTLLCLHSFCYKCLDELITKNSGRNSKFKCPLCQEDHLVPEKGASGFRQDFRIKTLVDKMNMLNIDGAGDHSPLLVQEAGTKCELHPQFTLRYFCREENEAICEKCWGTFHEKHAVSLLMKNVHNNTCSSDMEQECVDYKNKLASLIARTLDAKETLATSVNDIRSRFIDAVKRNHSKLDDYKQTVLIELDENASLQESLISDEIESLLKLQELLQSKAKASPKTSYQVAKILQEIYNLGDDIDRRCFSFKTPKLHMEPIDKLMKIIWDMQHIENEQCEGERRTVQGELLQESVSSSGQILRGNQLQLVIPNTEKNAFPSIQPNVPQTLGNRLSPQSTNFVNLLPIACWNVQLEPVMFMTYSPKVGLLAIQNGSLTAYDNATFTYVLWRCPWIRCPPTEIDILECSSGECLVELSANEKILRFYPQSDTCATYFGNTGSFSLRDICPTNGVLEFLSCIANYLFYSCVIGNETYIFCVEHVSGQTANHIWRQKVEPFSLVRSICGIQQGTGPPFVVCACWFPPKILLQYFHPNRIILAAMCSRREVGTLWTKTCSELDPHGYGFGYDLVDMVFDGKQIFVLNARACRLYVLSIDGIQVQRVRINMHDVATIRPGWRMTVDRERKRLIIANQDNTLDIYAIDGNL